VRQPFPPLLGAAGSITAGGALFSVTQHVPFPTGLYWALSTATTVGYGDVTPRGVAARLIASAVMLTAIPMLAAVFAWLTGHHIARRAHPAALDAAAARRIAADLYLHHTGARHPEAPQPGQPGRRANEAPHHQGGGTNG
jgi:voltage-gated potassium channel Kch